MRPLTYSIATLALLSLALPGHAQFKVVGPDGRITYTDRPPPAEVGRAAPDRRDAAGAEQAAAASLPFELRQVTARFPVTLYSSPDCAPCEAGRRMLQARGIPYVERRVVSEEDADAMNRLTGGRSVPSLTIGSQALRGYSDTDWHSYLDAAGYPRESRLPRGYQPPAATPLVAKQAETVAATSNAQSTGSPEPVIVPPPPPPPSPTGIRF